MIKSRADMDRYLAAQLEKLGTDHIDYYLIHSLDGKSWDNLARLGVRDFLDQAKMDGRITNPGFSFHGLVGDFKRIVDAYPWTFCQIQYNYLDENRQAGTEGLEYAAAKGLGVIVMEPLRGGNLASAVPPGVEAIWSEAKVRRTPAEWALRWIWNRPEVTVILSGMNDESNIRENLSIANTARANALSKEELQLVERVGRKYEELMKVGCTGCGYCMPCPEGVNIPANFSAYNQLSVFEDRMRGRMIPTAQRADICKECGQCEDLCPQKLPIRELLKDVAREFPAGETFAMPSTTAKP
jgi:hypothetical protein